MSMSYPERTAFFCSSILLRSSSVIVRLMVLMALFWSTDWMCIVTISLDSISRKSFSSWSLRSEAVMERKLIAPYSDPIWNVFPPGKEKLLGAIKSFTDNPDAGSHFQSK